MPLSELVYQLAEGKKFDSSSQEKLITCSTDQSSGPGNDFVELVWENGQIQFNRARKMQTSNGVQCQTLNNKNRDIGYGSNTKMGRFVAMDSVLDELPMSVPSVEMGLNQDDDMVPWLNYPMDYSLEQDYCHDVFTELSGITVNENAQNSFESMDKKSSVNQSVRDLHTMSVHNGSSFEQGRMLRVSSAPDGNATRPGNTASYLDSSSSRQGQTSFPRSQVWANNGENGNNLTHLASSEMHVPPSGGGRFPSIKVQKQFPGLPSTNSGLMNFSQFSRPAAIAKSNVQDIGTNDSSEISSIERIGNKDKGATPSCSNPSESMLMSSHCHSSTMSSKVDSKQLKHKPAEEPLPAKRSVTIYREDDSRDDKSHCQFAESATKGLTYSEKMEEPMVASSSVCSGNSVERVSDEPTQNLKKKQRETEESEGPGEDIEEELVGGKKATPGGGGTGSKRSRAAEVHNLSERRRRDRINEKMRALQELIPNCNKVDKASMLDEAIEYLKMLQLQVQIMSMGAGLYMPSMMLPPGMPQMQAAQMAQLSSMGVGMGMGMGFGMGMPDLIGGSSGCSMIHVPPMHVAHFPGPPISGTSPLLGTGASNMHMFSLSSQGHPMPYPFAPLMPMPGGPLPRTTLWMNAGVPGPMDNMEPVLGSSSKDSVRNDNSQVMQNSGADSLRYPSSVQCRVKNECLEQPALVQSSVQASKVTDSQAPKSADGNDNAPGGAAGGSD